MTNPYNRLFTGVPDVDRETLLRTDDDVLKSACVLNSYTVNLCDTAFWHRRYIQEFGPLPSRLTTLDSIRSEYWKRAEERKRHQSLLAVVEIGDLDQIDQWAQENDGNEVEVMKATIEVNYPDLLKLLFDEFKRHLNRSYRGYDEYVDLDVVLQEIKDEIWNELIDFAIEIDRPECFEALMEFGDLITEVAALTAVDLGRFEIVKLILKYTGDEHLDEMIAEAVLVADDEMVTYLEDWRASHR